MKETETDGNYFFRVILEDGSSEELMHCLNVVTESNINVKMEDQGTRRTGNGVPRTTRHARSKLIVGVRNWTVGVR